MSVAYITAESTKDDVYSAYIKAQKLLKMQRHINKTNQKKVSEVRKEKNKRYNELRYKMLKQSQHIYKLKKHIQNLQRFAINERSKAKKSGIEIGKGKIRVRDYSVTKMYTFLLQIDQASSIFKMKLNHLAFVLWAGKYTFFTKKDFDNDIPNSRYSFSIFVNQFRINNMIIAVHTDNRQKRYALNATGLDVFNKIDKFTKKHFNINE